MGGIAGDGVSTSGLISREVEQSREVSEDGRRMVVEEDWGQPALRSFWRG